MAYMASRRITLPLPLLLQYRRVMAYVASRRITLLLLGLVCRVMAYMASGRIIFVLPLLLLLLPAWLQYRAAPNTRDC